MLQSLKNSLKVSQKASFFKAHDIKRLKFFIVRFLLFLDYALSRQTCYIEVFLTTVDGQVMGLENWCFKLAEPKGEKAQITYQKSYKEMKALVVSLVSATRALPAFQLARNQGSDSYTVTTRVGLTQPNPQLLGSDPVNKTFGTVSTPVGEVAVELTYRSRAHLFLSPQSSRMLTDGLRDDHFNLNSSPRMIPQIQAEKMGARQVPKTKIFCLLNSNYSTGCVHCLIYRTEAILTDQFMAILCTATRCLRPNICTLFTVRAKRRTRPRSTRTCTHFRNPTSTSLQYES